MLVFVEGIFFFSHFSCHNNRQVSLISSTSFLSCSLSRKKIINLHSQLSCILNRSFHFREHYHVISKFLKISCPAQMMSLPASGMGFVIQTQEKSFLHYIIALSSDGKALLQSKPILMHQLK